MIRDMKVKNWINNKIITIHRSALLQEAVGMMKRHNIRHLPVMEEDELVGFVTESDLRQFSFPSMVEDIPVHQVMVTNPVTIDVNTGIDVAAKIIHDKKIGGLPVLDDGKLAGVITASDVLSAFIEVMGVLHSSTRLDLQIDEGKGGLENVTKIIQENGGEIVNVAMDTHSGKNKVYYFRLERCEIEPIVKAIEDAGHKIMSVME
jgi:acetoin utilization protein AcuB